MKSHNIFEHWINNRDKESIRVFMVLIFVFGFMLGVSLEYALMGGALI